jgi:hypothetical protein
MMESMELVDFVQLIALSGLEVALILSFWLAAIHFKKPDLKRYAQNIAIFGFFFIGCYGMYLYDLKGPRPDYATDVIGTLRESSGSNRDVYFYLVHEGEVHQIELTGQVDEGQTAQGKLELYCKLMNKQDKLLDEGVFEAQPTGGRKWRTVSFPFTPEEAGDFVLKLMIPSGVHSVHVVVKEPR